MKANFGVSVVVPVYNNAPILRTTIRRLTEYLNQEFVHFEIIFVDDGSSDESVEILEDAAMKSARIRVLRHATNLGQQQATADGALMAREQIIVTVDSDLPCALSDLKKIATLAAQGTELVLGYRISDMRRTWWRRLGSRMAGFLVRLLYPYDIRDFGCSTGAVRRSLVDRLRHKSQDTRQLKILLLKFAESYTETLIQASDNPPRTTSSYSFSKLMNFFWQIVSYRLKG